MNFGISGYLYRSAVLYYDKETETFWEQMTGKAVIGPQTGRQLKWIPTTVTTWDKWRKKHPFHFFSSFTFPMMKVFGHTLGLSACFIALAMRWASRHNLCTQSNRDR